MYVVYKGKVVEVSDAGGNEAYKNQQVSDLGISGVNFGSSAWTSQLKSAGAQQASTKEQADKFVKEYEDKQAKIAYDKNFAENQVLAQEIKRVTGGSYAASDEKIASYTQKIDAINSEIDALKNAPASTKLDSEYYYKKYPEVKPAGYSAERHYNQHGQKEGRFANEEQEIMQTKGSFSPERLKKIEALEKKKAPLQSVLESYLIPTERESKVPAELDLSAQNNYALSDLAKKLNSQVTNDQILNDLNTSRQKRISKAIEDGNTQIVGINQKIKLSQSLLDQMDANNPNRKNSQLFIDQLKNDLKSVTGAVTNAQNLQKTYKPITAGSPEAAKEITSFRSFLNLPEQNAALQIKEIDPESYKTATTLGKEYGKLATSSIGQTQNAQTEAFRAQLEKGYRDYSTSPIGATRDAQTEAYRAQLQKEIQGYSLGKIGATTSPEAEALRRQVEGETAAQLALGSRLGAEEQRQYQQYSRGAQAARGNIFGVAPAVEEAVTTGMAGEARKQARYGAASQFLSSGQTTSDALARDTQLREALQQGRYQAGGAMLASGQTVSDAMARDVQLRNALQQSKLGAGGQFLSSGQTLSDALRGDIAFRDALQQNRLGAAANFVAGGPSLYNLGQARTANQQNAFQGYIQANQPTSGGFNQQPSTAANFYQTVDPSIPVALTNAFNQLFRSQADYKASTYGAQVGALSRQETGSQAFGNIASGLGNLFSFNKSF